MRRCELNPFDVQREMRVREIRLFPRMKLVDDMIGTKFELYIYEGYLNENRSRTEMGNCSLEYNTRTRYDYMAL